MNGPIAQVAALVVYGNEYLHGSAWSAFWPSANVFKYCKHVGFIDGPEGAGDPSGWFSLLERRNVRSLRLHNAAGRNGLGSDREMSAFVGGGRGFSIEAVGTKDSAIWEAIWHAGPKDNRGAIWEVEYHCILGHVPHASLTPSNHSALHATVRQTLVAISAFAKRHDLGNFAEAFDEAWRALDADDPLKGTWGGDFGHATLLPRTARQLLGASAAAWVFGGMGSWNDMGFDGADQAEYTRLSDTLYAQLCDSVCAAVNSATPAV